MSELTNAYINYDDGRLYIQSDRRLTDDEHQALLRAGFHWDRIERMWWANWTPEREDVVIEICGDIHESLIDSVDRAQVRAAEFRKRADAARGRFATLDEKRRHLTGMLADEPIKVGHHSEGRHRKDLERVGDIQREMAALSHKVRYWEDRAEAVTRQAEQRYTVDGLRHRMIKLVREKKRLEKVISESWTRDQRRRLRRWVGFVDRRIETVNAQFDRARGRFRE